MSRAQEQSDQGIAPAPEIGVPETRVIDASAHTEGVPRRRSRAGLLVLVSLVAAGMIISLVVFAALGRSVSAPDFLRDRVAAELSEMLPGLEVAFGDLAVQIGDGGHPTVMLRDISLRDPLSGAELRLAEMDGMLAVEPLLRGRLAPSEIRMSGAQIALQRAKNGELAFSLEGGDTRGVDPGQIVYDIDRIMQSDQLAYLERADLAALTLRYEDLRAKRGWTVDGAQVSLERLHGLLRMRGDFAVLSGGDSVSLLEATYEGEIGTGEVDLSLNFGDVPSEDLASQSAALAFLDPLRSDVSGALRTRVRADGTFGELYGSLHANTGVLQPTDTIRPIPFERASSYFSYDPQTHTAVIDQVVLESKWVALRASGRAQLRDFADGMPNQMVASLDISQISGNPGQLYEKPVEFGGLGADFRVRLDPFSVDLGQFWLQDQGAYLIAQGHLRAQAEDWDLVLRGEMDRLDPKRVVALWPQNAAGKTRKWIVDNVLGGEARDVNFTLRSKPKHPPQIYLDFDYTDAHVRFLPHMPPLVDGAGHAELTERYFMIEATRGEVQTEHGALDASGTVFIVEDIRRKPSPGRVLINAAGGVAPLMSILNSKPLEVLKKAKLPENVAEGRVRAQGALRLPLIKKVPIEEVAFDFRGDIHNVTSDKLVPGHVLRAPKLAVHATNAQVEISGQGQLSDVAFDARWTLPLARQNAGKSRIEARAQITDKGVRGFGVALPKGSLRGRAEADVTVDLSRDAPPKLRVESDLKGLAMGLGALGWAKGAKTKGALRLEATLGKPVSVEHLDLSASGLRAKGSVLLHKNGKLDRVRLSDLDIGRWLSARVDLVGRGAKPPAIEIIGGTVDLRKMPKARTGATASGSAGPITARLDRLRLSDSITLTNFAGEFTTTKGGSGRFSARVNKSAPISGTMIPHQNGRAFRITSQDAGAVMRAAGVLKNASGGVLDLRLIPSAVAGTYQGTVRAQEVRLRDAPAMAGLLNAISVVGILEQLSGEGILFTEVDADFSMNAKEITLHSASAVGASMGLSMDGKYYLGNGTFDMQGVISPVYLLNSIGRAVSPRKGEGLFGFHYRLSGTAEKPKVRVNPFSVLTPGGIRDIFRHRPKGQGQ